MIEQDLDAPYVPDGMREFQVGDKVRFSMGERMPVKCPECKGVSLPTREALVQRLSGTAFNVRIREYPVPWWCCDAGTQLGDRPVQEFPYFLVWRDLTQPHLKPMRFAVCANELTLVSTAEQQREEAGP